MIEGNAIEVALAGGASLTTTTASSTPLSGVGGISLLVTPSWSPLDLAGNSLTTTASVPLFIALLASSFSVEVRTASLTTLISGKEEKGEKDRMLRKLFGKKSWIT
jgi:hypothetical protein